MNGDQGKDRDVNTLFGPNIGIMDAGPKWTEPLGEKVAQDEITPDVVKAWIDKSKESVQPTTTLQALVNLKRPTLRLTPLQPDADDAHTYQDGAHALEFEFDADAPKCAINVSVVLPGAPRDRRPVYEGTFDGGFGRTLTINDGATLDLGMFEPAATPAVVSPKLETVDEKEKEAPTPMPELPHTTSGRRFTVAIPFRRRHAHQPSRSVAGPALAVLDNDAPTGPDAPKKEGEDEGESGVRVIITLTALNEDGTVIAPANKQTTYLHVMRYGVRSSEETGTDTRPWVVKVVKREATIGPHTFHLHEIYGLSSASSAHTHAPTAPLPDANSTYPPTSAPAPPPAAPVEDEPSSECLLCLSAPREVVLLPCRHLVACKDCALNMVEFGAGGQIVHNEEPTDASAATATSPTIGAEGAASPPVSAAPGTAAAETQPLAPIAPVPARPRKRRAKGWFCPVCRQPYTSLLRITNAPPPADGKRVSTASSSEGPRMPEPAVMPPQSASRPGFLRGLSGRVDGTQVSV
ncbi:hypothetical protein PENSPDRAFT_584133 [Peniophora sp. CONT]|nr:hypothetical protein PENSPDRAFT_584133 [Peniophora sp. CONT]